ncbi:hypothetical protein B0A78_08335 [Flavobacterium columnare NBRC 100251 = ATCC 23463]|uniref:Lipocalin-like domain-containing protein n=2 Tax=Flavobacterium columnare TaxID=996 RepID=G8X668_FLACA|nr:lipocalin family protein [Flavobacterium columnare]AEW86298.1 hypothetical protein FCOL_07395 [Flavobacterium columnare ATCC 49512]AMO19992.1 hypothetical protein UN65_06180 [Flavobacterium columnare]ANO48495.1 hypothetical protein Pf1_00247 [Flavobacterium columnare]APT23446.1 hypothetical protein BU993_12935 [Flavobacterium columnare]AUX17938.1 hypothetical protein AQ623_06325 [Flavobacterium columnare]
MRLACNILFVFLVISCTKKIELKELNKLNGYWQIEKVEVVEGEDKKYVINENYDYFEFTEKQGFHKKVRWQPTGKFLINDLQETIKGIEKEGEIYLEFSSKFGKHKDKLLKITDQEMILEAENGNENYYAKVMEDGKTIK